MAEDIKSLEARIRQLLAVDQNALAIYTNLAEQTTDPSIAKKLQRLAKDEARHVALEQQMLSHFSR